MISIFILLLLSHAFADFVFQTGRLYQWKVKSNWGILVHVIIFAATVKLMTWPLVLHAPIFWVWLVAATAAHFAIDKIKLITNTSSIQQEIQAFIYDQISHIAVLMTVFLLPIPSVEFWFRKTSWISWCIHTFPALGSWPNVMQLLMAMFLGIYVAYAVSVLLYYYDRTVNPALTRLHYQITTMTYRLVLFGLLLSPWRGWVILAILLHAWRDRQRLVFDRRRFALEYTLLLGLWIIFELMKRSLL